MDFQKLADKLGYKNVRSAADSYYRFRRGLDLGVSSSSSSSSNPSTRSSIRKKPRLRKRKVIYSDDDGGEEEEEEEGGENEDSGSGGDAAGCEIKQECTEGDGVRIKLEGDNEEAIFVKSESEGEDDDGSVIGRNNRRKSREEGGWFSGFQGTGGYRHASTGTGGGFEGARFDGYGVLGGLQPPLVVVEKRALPEKVAEKEGVVVIKDEPVDEEKWVWKW